MDWLNSIGTTKDAWVYLVFSIIGLYSNVYWTIKEEKRGPKWADLLELAGHLPLVISAAIYFDYSPLLSLVIGIAPDRIFDLLRKKGLSLNITSPNEFPAAGGGSVSIAPAEDGQKKNEG